MDCRNCILRALLVGLFFFLVLANSAHAATLNVPANYSTIQAAVNAAAAGDTIRVSSGIYKENVNVNKQLTLEGVDSGSGLPVVDAIKSGSAITLSADGCILQDFVARNSSSSSSGIRVSSRYNAISGNTATGNYYGIYLSSSSGNNIFGNTATSNNYGIYLSSSSSNIITGNTATGNTNFGIYLGSSNSNNITGNTADGNAFFGIYLGSSGSNTISGNTATGNNFCGISLYSSSGNSIIGNTAIGNANFGIQLRSSSSNSINGNTATGNSNYGIYLGSSGSNTITGNTANDNNIGICLGSSSHNNISRNTFCGNNGSGICLEISAENTIYLNTFDNTNNAWSNRTNFWNATTSQIGHNLTGLLGNIWSDYDGFDCNGDGIGDTPYPIPGGSDKDYHPIGGVLCSPGLEAEKIANRSEAGVGDWINYTVQVNNTGNVNLTGVRMEDKLTGAVWNVGTLEPGQNYTNTTRYQVNLSDLPGPLINELQANGTDPCGGDVNDSAIKTVNITGHGLLCISGYKIDECTGDGLADWEIILTNSSGEVDRTTTNATGYYEFCGLESGDYDLAETLKPGWMAGYAPGTFLLNLTNVTCQNFTNHKLLCISGYNLDNCTGTALANWTITLNNSTYSATATTDATGYYEFCGLWPGDYSLNETLNSSWFQRSAPGVVTLNCANVTDQNFTNDNGTSIHGRKIDLCTKSGIENWKIHLLDKDGSVIETATTDKDGNYEFKNRDKDKGPYALTEQMYPGSGWHKVSGPDPTKEINLAACKDFEAEDFVNVFVNLSISGYKLDECNGTGLAGWDITLTNGTYIATVTTNATGYYEFSCLWPGDYNLTETLKPGWLPVSAPGPVTLNCTNETNKNFVNHKFLCINGTKTNALTGDPLGGCYINLTAENGTVVGFTTTEADGRFSFCGLEPGNYTICEFMPGSWKNVTDRCIYVELECQDVFINFQNVPTALCINGSKINNCTGEGLANWTIELKDDTGAVITATETDKNGDYSFCSLEPGNYTVCEQLDGGWKNVTARCIDVVLDRDNSEDNDFLNDPPVCISGTKINDCTDQGIAGWKIFLYDALGNKIGEAVTDATGRYSFCDLDFGIYYVCEEKREGWIPVQEERGTTVPSNGISEPATCNMPWCDDNCVCVDLDCQDAVVDFRNIPESLCINGSKINNCTGAGIEKWGIYLYDATGKQIAATQTDRNGHYSFCGLAPGQYRVCEEIRDGYIPVTNINHSGASCLPEDCTCDVCNNCIPVILDCENSEENDFENIPPTSIKGKVIDDCTGLALKGWTVKLYDDRGVQLTSRTTGADGSYAFTSSSTGGLQLKAGTLYSVCEVVKDGYTPVTYHANNSSPAMSNVYCIPVLLECGETEVDDFENIPSLIISGHEFNHCTGEGLDGWTVHLKDGAGNILDATTTDGAGYYEFSGRQPGWYTVCEDSIPEGWTSFRDDPNSPAMAVPDASAAPEDCEKPKCIVVRLDYCEDGADNDFENIPPFCINGSVFNNSTPMVGFPIKIENSDGTLIQSIPTDAYGEYSFCGLKAGTYTVCLNKPGWTADEPCAIVYLDCMDEEHDFDVYKGRSNVLPGIEQPAITLDDSSGAVVQGDRSGEPSEPTEPDIGGDEEEGRQTQL